MPTTILEECDDFGHYEKVESNKTQYFFVPGDDPSKIPDAEIVGNKEWQANVEDLYDGDIKGLH